MLWLFSGLFVTTHWIGLFTNFSAVLSGLAVPKPPSLMGTVMTTSARFSISVSCRNTSSGRVSTSGIAAELRPPCTCEGPLWWRSFLSDSASRRRNVSLCHYGRRNQLMGRRYGNRLARQVNCDLRSVVELQQNKWGALPFPSLPFPSLFPLFLPLPLPSFHPSPFHC